MRLPIIALLAVLTSVSLVLTSGCDGPCDPDRCQSLINQQHSDVECCPGTALPADTVPKEYVYIHDNRPIKPQIEVPWDSSYISVCPCDSNLILVDTTHFGMEDEDFVKASKPKGEGNYKYTLPELPYGNWIDLDTSRKVNPSTPHVKIAILDSGLDDVYRESFGDLVDDQREMFGFTPDVHDIIGHGSVVTSIISQVSATTTAATSRYLIYKCVNDKGYATSFSIACAIRCAQNNEADLINISLGAYVKDTVVRYALNQSERPAVIASKGNDCVNTEKQPHYPSDFPGVFGVAALNNAPAFKALSGDVPELWPCTNGMSGDTLLSAPATVVSPEPGGPTGNGTSFAAAHFTGVCARKLFDGLSSTSDRPKLINDWLANETPFCRYLYATDNCTDVLVLR